MKMFVLISGWLGLLMSTVCVASPATERLAVIADNSIAASDREVHYNAGAKSVVRIKGIQHILIFKFDLDPIRGWRVHRARLYLHAVREHRLRTIGLSTISSDWQEGAGTDKAAEGGSSFSHAVYPHRRWAGEQSDFTDVSFGAGYTRYAFVEVRSQPDDWLEIEVSSHLVAAMLSGASYGLAVSDETGQTRWNNDVHSREDHEFAPYLVVEGEPAGEGPPPGVTVGQVQPEPRAATLRTGAVRLDFTNPSPGEHQSQAFAYRLEMRADGSSDWVEVARYLIPFAEAPGTRQSLTVPGLKPDTRMNFRLTMLDEAGIASAPTVFSGRSSPAKSLPQPLPDMANFARASTTATSVFAVPDTVKVDPISGDLLEVSDDAAYRRHNTVWDGQTVHLMAARNEVVGFQLAIEATGIDSVVVSDWTGDVGVIPASQFRWYRVWWVRDGDQWFPEVALPLNLPPQEPISRQRYTILWGDLLVPKDAVPGEYQGTLTLTVDERTVDIPLRLRVWRLTLPDQPRFVVDLNGYSSVARQFGMRSNTPEGIAIEHAYHRLAHAHRSTLDLLPYSQSGLPQEGWVPPVENEGGTLRIQDWSDYDAHYGPLFDGSAFTEPPGQGTPLHHQYLPFHENYPMPIESHYAANRFDGSYPELIARHALEAPPIEDAFTSAYQQGFKEGVRAFVRHFREQGWTSVEMHCYLNNKYYYKNPDQGGRGTSWWLLDEPMHRDDWRALTFFGRLFKDAVRESDVGIPFRYRCDISRPQWVRDPDAFLPLVDLMVVSREFFRKNQRCLEYQRRYGTSFWHYGTANGIGESNLNAEAWAVKAFLLGADGILPWNTIGTDRSFERPTPTALLYPGKRFGLNSPLASLRLKALRRGQQDVEYLLALAERFSYDREQLAFAVAQRLNLTARTETQFVDDAGSTVFEGLRAEDFFALRQSIAAALE